MARRGARGARGAVNWELVLGLIAAAFILYAWVWAATRGGPPFV